MLFAFHVRSTLVRSALAFFTFLPILSYQVGAAEPSKESARLGRVVAPFITPNTQSIVYIDVEGLDLKKIGDEVLTKSSGPEMIKGLAMGGLSSLAEKHDDLKKAGIVEFLMVSGGKIDAEGKPAGPPEVIAVVRKSPNAKPEAVIAKVQELVPPEAKPFIAETWVSADWIAMGPADPQTLAAPKEQRPIKLATDLFDHLLTTGRGAHFAFIPQAEIRKTAKDLIAKGSENIPPVVPPQVKSLPKLGELLVDGQFTTLSIVAAPETKIVFTASAADADAAKEVSRILVNLVEMIPDLPQFQEDADAAKKLVASLTPKMAHNQVTVSLQTSDGSLNQVVSLGLEAAGPFAMLLSGPPPGFGDGPGLPPGLVPPEGFDEEMEEEEVEDDADATEEDAEEEGKEEEEEEK